MKFVAQRNVFTSHPFAPSGAMRTALRSQLYRPPILSVSVLLKCQSADANAPQVVWS